MNYFFDCCRQKEYVQENVDAVLDNLDILGHPKKALGSVSKIGDSKVGNRLIMEIIDQKERPHLSKGIKKDEPPASGTNQAKKSAEESSKSEEENHVSDQNNLRGGPSNKSKGNSFHQVIANVPSHDKKISSQASINANRMGMESQISQVGFEMKEESKRPEENSKMKHGSDFTLGQGPLGLQSGLIEKQKKESSDYFLPDFGANKGKQAESSLAIEALKDNGSKLNRSTTTKEAQRSRKYL